MANLTRDQRLVKENPTLSAYELLQKGLSQDAYNKLVQENYQPQGKIKPEVQQPVIKTSEELIREYRENSKASQPVKPVVTRATPKINKPAQVVRGKSNMAYLHNKKTGKKTYMTRASAEFAAKLDKGNYNVI